MNLKPGDGRIATVTAVKGSGLVPVNVDGAVVSVLADRDTTYSAGDVVWLQRFGSQWVATNRLFTAATTPPEDNEPPPPSKPDVVTGTTTISPIETRSYRSSGWRTDTSDVYQGSYGGWGNHTGCAFYGSKARSLDGATVTSARVRIRRPSRGGQAAAQALTLRLVTQATRPGDAPTLGSSTSGPSLRWGQETTFTLPDSWGQALVDGTAGGLAVHESDGSPYVILAGRGSWSPAFTLTLGWTRST